MNNFIVLNEVEARAHGFAKKDIEAAKSNANGHISGEYYLSRYVPTNGSAHAAYVSIFPGDMETDPNMAQWLDGKAERLSVLTDLQTFFRYFLDQAMYQEREKLLRKIVFQKPQDFADFKPGEDNKMLEEFCKGYNACAEYIIDIFSEK